MKIKYTPEQIAYFKKMGRRGGLQTKKRHGTNHFKRIAKKLSTTTPLASLAR